MRINRKYFVAVALLAILAVVFGVVGTVAPPLAETSSSSSSSSVGHFQNPPTYDSGWLNITDRLAQSFTLTHNLNTTDAFVDVVGKQSTSGEEHKMFFGTGCFHGWNISYGTVVGSFYSSVQTADGGYAMAGYTTPMDFWLVKTDSSGRIEWQRTYGGPNWDVANSVIQTADGGYAIAGYTQSYGAGFADFWLIKTDSTGNMDWSQTYGDTLDDVGYSVVQTADGGYAIAGYTYSYGAGASDFWLVKTDAAGTLQWSIPYGGADYEMAYSLIQTTDGGYAMAGCTMSYGAGGYDFYFVKTNAAGAFQWHYVRGGTLDDVAYSVIQTADGYVMAGYTRSFGSYYQFYLVKRHESLAPALSWTRTYGGSGREEAYSLVQTADGGYAIAGHTTSYGAGGYDAWLVKTDSAGYMVWSQTYGGPAADGARSLIKTADGGYALAGGSDTWGWMVKDELGLLIGLSMTHLTDTKITFYRARADTFWNFIRVRMWLIKEPSWMFGDINMDGIVDAKDLAIIGQNYGKTFSALSLGGIIAIVGIYTYKKQKQPK